MTPFTAAVDRLLAAEKSVAGQFLWKESAIPLEMTGYWPLLVAGVVTDHRLMVVAKPRTQWRGFTVMVMIAWGGREIPFIRLNVDTPSHAHDNRPPRPPHLPATANGNRIYLWEDNRERFTPTMQGLPFARQMNARSLPLDSAIRLVASHGRISLAGATLPDYPRLPRLV